MTPIIDRGKHVTMVATVAGIAVAVEALIMASHKGLPPPRDVSGVKIFWALATTGVFWATLFNLCFEKWLWRISLLQGWLVKVPDLTGTWKGISESRYFKDPTGTFQQITLCVTIEHRFDRIIYTQRGVTTSRAIAADLGIDESGSHTLVVAYFNSPSPNAAQQILKNPQLAASVREHHGCARLVLDRPNAEVAATTRWSLKGKYWTDKPRGTPSPDDRGTWGVMDLRWQTRKLLC